MKTVIASLVALIAGVYLAMAALTFQFGLTECGRSDCGRWEPALRLVWWVWAALWVALALALAWLVAQAIVRRIARTG